MPRSSKIATKRAYLPASDSDGYRVLVDRMWPRGVRREDARIDEWAKHIAPSTRLRQWYGHDPARWAEFRKRYRDELATSEAKAALDALRRRAQRSKVTLVFAAKDEVHCNAEALRAFLSEPPGG